MNTGMAMLVITRGYPTVFYWGKSLRKTDEPRFGAIDFAHWFFPLRGGGGAVGGMLGAFKREPGWSTVNDISATIDIKHL